MSTVATTNKKLTAYPFLTIFSIFLMFGFGYVVKPWSTVTDMGVKIIGVYLGVLLMLICTKETIWPPILGMFALLCHRYATASAMLQNWMGNSTVVMLLFILALCGALKESGAPIVMANYLMTRKITRGRPGLFLFMLFLATTILSMLTSGTASILMMYQVAGGLVDACGYDRDSKEHKFILLGIYISNIGAYMLPFKGIHLSTLAVATGIMESYGVEFNSLLYLLACCFTVVIFLILFILLMKTVFKCDLKPLANVDTSNLKGLSESGTKLNTRQALLFGAFLFGIVVLLIQMFLPKSSAVNQFLSSIGSTWPWIVIFCLLCIPHMKDGKSFINGSILLRDNAMWGTVCMIACISMCGQAMSNADYGIRDWLLKVFTPILGNMSFVTMVIAVAVFCTILTQFLNGPP